ncbi:MAG TPA: VWA domain-containing protein [Thermoanaerobaculia bacterium]|nr:VWA domain-containing protein [Thermoanaerobaculia bacterium]
MKARLACFVLPLVLASVAPAAAPPGEMLAPPSFKEVVEINVVNVDVRVTDSQGNPVSGLSKRDFELFEDGKRVDISNFDEVTGGARAGGTPADGQVSEPSPSPAAENAWNLIVYVDNFDLHTASRTRALRQLRENLGRLLAPGDRVMLVSWDLGLKIQLPFSSDPAAIDETLARMEGLAVYGNDVDNRRRHAYTEIFTIQEASLSDPQPLPCPLRIAVPAHDFSQSRRDEVLRTLSGLTVLVNSLSGVPGRKAVLHVSDGLPTTPGEEVFQFLAELCGGGSGTGGIGQNTANPELFERKIETAERQELGLPLSAPKPRDFAPHELDPRAVYDARMLGPGAYQAASQAPIDAATYSVEQQLAALVAHANAQRVTLYTLQASGAERPEASEGALGAGDRLTQFQSIETAARTGAQSSLYALASGTGGRAILNVNDFRPDLLRMREDFASYYSLGFVPAHRQRGGEHRLEVKVKRRGVQLRYQESYRDKTVVEKAVDRTLAALFYSIEDNPLKIGLEIGEQAPSPDGSFAVPVRLQIPLAKVGVLRGDGVYEGSLRVLVAARGADGRTAPVKQIAVPIRIPHKEVLTALGQTYVYTLTLQLAPGEQRVAVGVRDELSANASYLSRAVTVGTSAAIVRP